MAHQDHTGVIDERDEGHAPVSTTTTTTTTTTELSDHSKEQQVSVSAASATIDNPTTQWSWQQWSKSELDYIKFHSRKARLARLRANPPQCPRCPERRITSLTMLLTHLKSKKHQSRAKRYQRSTERHRLTTTIAPHQESIKMCSCSTVARIRRKQRRMQKKATNDPQKEATLPLIPPEGDLGHTQQQIDKQSQTEVPPPSSIVRQHEPQHRNWKCIMCGKTFSRNATWTSHLLSHAHMRHVSTAAQRIAPKRLPWGNADITAATDAIGWGGNQEYVEKEDEECEINDTPS